MHKRRFTRKQINFNKRGVRKMGRIIYKVLIEENEIAIFYELDDAMVFIKGLCEKYYSQLKEGFDFTIKEEVEGEKEI